MKKTVFLVIVLSACAIAAPGDREAIREAALNYIEGWYEGDGARMESALHPELAKRMVFTTEHDRSELHRMGAMTLVQRTRNGGGKNTPNEQRIKRVKILDIYENAASVRVEAAKWIDYLHLAKWNGEWKIINVLWELKPKE